MIPIRHQTDRVSAYTPAMQAQIDQCRRMIYDGATNADILALGYAQAAIDKARRKTAVQEISEMAEELDAGDRISSKRGTE